MTGESFFIYIATTYTLEVCDNVKNYIVTLTTYTKLSRLSKISNSIITFTRSICLTYKCSKNTIRKVYYKFSDKSTNQLYYAYFWVSIIYENANIVLCVGRSKGQSVPYFP